MENIFNNGPKNGYKIMFFNGVLLRNDLYQRMIVNIAHKDFIRTLSLIASAIMIKNHRLPLTVCIISFGRVFPSNA